jgi:hypothetical protein
MKNAVSVLAAVILLFAVSGSTWEFYSPGALSSFHAAATGDNLDGCATCHEPYKGLAPNRCLTCHDEVAQRMARKTGFHGVSATGKPCETCHHEHRGSRAAIVDWPGGREHFLHSATGFEIEDYHASLTCDTCHRDSRIEDPAIAALRGRYPEHRTFLGLSTDCEFCHTH